MSWSNVAGNAQSWTTAATQTQAWVAAARPSAESRLNRVFPQSESTIHTPGELDFMWQIRSEFPWFVASGNGVQVKSSITEGI